MKFFPLFSLLCLGVLGAQAHEAHLQKAADGSFSLIVDGASYVARGAGGESQVQLLKDCGANSIRTWGTEQTDLVIDEAARLGLSVCAGLWIDHERHGVDYTDPAQFKAQVERHCRAVDRLKDKPALLMWAVGNEVETHSSNPRVYDVIEAVAAYIKKVDPKHPVMTVMAHAAPGPVGLIRSHCPSVDILGCNSYAGLTVLARHVRESGWTGPYMVTEWGSNGSWEVSKTTWGAEVEPGSSVKAAMFRERHALLLADSGHCLGSYAFFWGQKQETTATWFNLFTEDGERTEAIGVLAGLWGGRVPEPAAPTLSSLTLNGRPGLPGVVVAPGAELHAEGLGAGEGEADWRLYRESEHKGLGGDRELRPERVELGPVTVSGAVLGFRAPSAPGAYRLYLYLRRGGAAGTANIPFLVKVP
jgi:hypothetical protein